MPKISKQKRDKIAEQILYYLFSVSPEPKFTVDIAREIARDEEFTKILLIELMANKLAVSVGKNSLGKEYLRRQRWLLSPKAYEIYSKSQNKKY